MQKPLHISDRNIQLSQNQRDSNISIENLKEITKSRVISFVGMLSLCGSIASAQDYQSTVQDNQGVIQKSEAVEVISWIQNLNVSDEKLSRFIILSLEGNNKYSRKALQELATYTPEEQIRIARLVYDMGHMIPNAKIGEKEIALVRELRVPSASIEDMMTEASEKGVSERRQRKLVEVISDLQAFGQITKGQLRALERYVPDTSKFVPAVRLTQESLKTLAESEARLAESEARLTQVEEDLETATAARIASEARVVESEARVAESEALAKAAREGREVSDRALQLLGSTFGNNG